ncbi:MAG: DUF402 domain-containing protein [Pyrinomonadaceae bacterium]
MHYQAVTVNSRKYDNSINRSWNCRLVERHNPLLIFVGEFETDVNHSDLGFIRRGTQSYEYYWLDRWYNVFRFHEPEGTFRNFYCNVNMPPAFKEGVLDYVDLEIDVLVQPDFSYKILDIEEFKANEIKFAYPVEVVLNAGRALEEIIQSIKNREFPFDWQTANALRCG